MPSIYPLHALDCVAVKERKLSYYNGNKETLLLTVYALW